MDPVQGYNVTYLVIEELLSFIMDNLYNSLMNALVKVINNFVWNFVKFFVGEIAKIYQISWSSPSNAILHNRP